MAQKLYTIERWAEAPLNKWMKLTSFTYMRKSFAEGAWCMLKAHYNQSSKHRLLCDGDVVDEHGYAKIKVN